MTTEAELDSEAVLEATTESESIGQGLYLENEQLLEQDLNPVQVKKPQNAM